MDWGKWHSIFMEHHPKLLLVEGNEIQEAKARQAITNSEIDCELRVAHDGCEACEILFNGHESVPTLIMLGLDLPKLNGFEVLARIRSCDETKRVPVVIFSASGEKADVERAFDLHANSYVHKDQDLDCYETRVKLLLYYWIAVNRNANT